MFDCQPEKVETPVGVQALNRIYQTYITLKR